MLAEHEPDAEAPHGQQADFGEQRNQRAEERPDDVQAVVDVEQVLIGALEALDFAPFLGKRLHDADAGNGVGQERW